VRGALLSLGGVDSVSFSANLRRVTVQPATGSTVTLKQLRKALREQGFFVRGAEIQVTGQLVENDGHRVLWVPPGGAIYRLDDHPDAPGRLRELRKSPLGTAVTVSGYVPQTWGGNADDPLRIRVRSFAVREVRKAQSAQAP